MTSTTEKYNPFAERNFKHATTDFDAFMHLLKGALGAKILAMPFAFYHIGLWAGLPAIAFVGVIVTYCLHLLVRASQTLCFRYRIPSLSYADTAEQAFRNDPKVLDKRGIAMRFIVNFFLVINSMSCVCIYFVNATRNLDLLIDIPIDLRLRILVLACPMLALSLIRDLKYLVPFSIIANAFVFASIVIICCFIFKEMPNPTERTSVAELKTWPAFFSISVFALQNIGIVLPCENEMKTPEHFTGCPSVLVAAMTLVVSVYTFVGFFGYLKYGDLIKTNISLNLPRHNGWVEAVKVMIGLAICFSILIQFFVASQIIWHGLKPKVAQKWQRFTECFVRIGLMSLCASIAAGFPDLGQVMSLVGAVTFSTLSFTIPALIDLMVIRTDPGYGFLKFRLIKDILILIFGLSVFISGSIVSIFKFQI